jgi:hypothetical protein
LQNSYDIHLKAEYVEDSIQNWKTTTNKPYDFRYCLW